MLERLRTDETGLRLLHMNGIATACGGQNRQSGDDSFKQDHSGTFCNGRMEQQVRTLHEPRDAAERAEVADLKGSDCRAVECKGARHCERDNRSMACRTFPFFPYFNSDGEMVGLATYWTFEGQCWVISNITIVEQPFVDEMMTAHEMLFKADPQWRETYKQQSATMRGVHSRKGIKFPVIARNGTYFWVLPKSGGTMEPAKKADLLKLRKGFPNFGT